MFRKTFTLMVFVLIAAQAWASGTVSIVPEKVPVDSGEVSLEMYYTPENTADWSSGNGSVSFIANENFYPEPTTVSGEAGWLWAEIVIAGGNTVMVDPEKIAIDGRAVTINSVALGPEDKLHITYGYVNTSAYIYGLNSPMDLGYYEFIFHENSDGLSSNVVYQNPKVEAVLFEINKSTAVSDVQSGETLTYTIKVDNKGTYHQVDNVSVWDSLPSGTQYLFSTLTPAIVNGSYIEWNIPSIGMAGSEEFLLAVTTLPGIRHYGNDLTNTIYAYAEDMYSRRATYSSSATVSTTGAVLESSVYSVSSMVSTGEQFTVRMTVSNSGNAVALSVQPETPGEIFTYGGSASMLSGPSPALMTLTAGNWEEFEWIYRADSAGMAAFSGRAFAEDGYSVIYSDYSVSSDVAIITPVPTSTFTAIVPTATDTSTPVLPTQTHTATAVDTATPLPPTETFTAIATDTFTSVPPTQTFTAEPTSTFTAAVPTHTSTAIVVISPTDVPTPVPTYTPDDNVYTDRNYFKPNNGEKLTLSYEVPADGNVEIQIMNLNGEVVKTLVKEFQGQGKYQVVWGAQNDAGNTVGRGIYFILIKQGNWQVMKKVVVLK